MRSRLSAKNTPGAVRLESMSSGFTRSTLGVWGAAEGGAAAEQLTASRASSRSERPQGMRIPTSRLRKIGERAFSPDEGMDSA